MPLRPYPKWWDDIEFFEPHEFDCPGEKHSGAFGMDEYFVRKLDRLRKEFGRPLIVTSGYRTAKHNAGLKNASPRSMHLVGRAADIKVAGQDAYELLALAISHGFCGVGVGQKKGSDWDDRFVHLDDRDSNVKAIWSY